MNRVKPSRLELAVMTPLDQREAEFGRRELHVLVYVDGQEVSAGELWEFSGIYEAGVRPGRFFFSNCDCGVPGCAGIYWPAVVEHKGGMVHWLIPQQPWTAPPRMPKRLRFDRAAYRAECERFAELLHACCNELACPGIKTTVTGDRFSLSQFKRPPRNRKLGASKAWMRHERAFFGGNDDAGGYRWRTVIPTRTEKTG